MPRSILSKPVAIFAVDHTCFLWVVHCYGSLCAKLPTLAQFREDRTRIHRMLIHQARPITSERPLCWSCLLCGNLGPARSLAFF